MKWRFIFQVFVFSFSVIYFHSMAPGFAYLDIYFIYITIYIITIMKSLHGQCFVEYEPAMNP